MPPTPPQGSAARPGYWAALAVAGAGLVGGIVSPLPGILVAALFAAVAIGIRRQHAWSAIAGVCFLLGPAPVAATHVPSGIVPVFVAGLLLELGVSFLLAQAAIELWHDPANRRPLPWAPLGALFVLFWIVFEPFAITGGSMEMTILPGDQVLVETATWKLGRSPDVGEIVVVQSPLDRKQRFLKRVVAGPGDRIRIRDKHLYRNGEAVDEPYVYHSDAAGNPLRDNFPSPSPIQLASAAEDMLRYHVVDGDIQLPEGKYFVLGDNRDESLDSRYWGFVSIREIVGNPLLVYGSYDAGRRAIFNSVRNLRWNRIGKLFR